MDFGEMVERATGHAPYPYQQRIAEEGLPELLEVPTGAGKTLAACLPWLWRRRYHADEALRRATPHWLVIALPMRVLVDQTVSVIGDWLENLGLTEQVGLFELKGGATLETDRWRLQPDRDAVFVATIDMSISRALNRGYAESRWSWPIDFGLFNNDVQWVFDEIQLLGPSLPTSRQLQAFRYSMGIARPTHSMWMSATVDLDSLSTVDAPNIATHVKLGEADQAAGIATRVGAGKHVSELVVEDPARAAAFASAIHAEHRAGTRTIVFCNTVERARDVYVALKKQGDGSGPDLTLVHSRFRPPDRRARLDEALAEVDTSGPGTIVVTTQVMEAGVDISCTTMITEVATWPSVVQRAGRCNRAGQEKGARLLWVAPPKAAPYEDADVAAAIDALRSLEGEEVTAESLPRIEVPSVPAIHAVLRRRDLIDLFDTTPDLTGNDIDVGRFIREAQDLDAEVAWRTTKPTDRRDIPGREERCPIPVGQLTAKNVGIGGDRNAWRLDPLAGEWIACRRGDVRPGMLVVLDATQGGYSPELGWNLAARSTPPVETGIADDDPLSEQDVAIGDDPLSTDTSTWLPLTTHLAEVGAEVDALFERIAPDLPPAFRAASVLAGELHDIGKAHPAFQAMLASTARDEHEVATRDAAPAPWAKSGGSSRARYQSTSTSIDEQQVVAGPADDAAADASDESGISDQSDQVEVASDHGGFPVHGPFRRRFRHELASALALLDEGSVALEGVEERDLTVYLVGAHHGRIRVGFRPLPDERANAARLSSDDADRAQVVLGILDGEPLPEVSLSVGKIPESRLRLDVMGLGTTTDGQRSWTARALGLRDRPDIGPFRLAYLEALVRLADWRASAGIMRELDVQVAESDVEREEP